MYTILKMFIVANGGVLQSCNCLLYLKCTRRRPCCNLRFLLLGKVIFIRISLTGLCFVLLFIRCFTVDETSVICGNVICEVIRRERNLCLCLNDCAQSHDQEL